MPGPQEVPTIQVLEMKKQGFNNEQVVQALQRDGFNMQQINEAMNQAEIKKGISPVPLHEGDSMPENPMSGLPQQPNNMNEMGSDILQKIEETAESIIDEKWTEFVENMKRVVDWKEKTEETIIKMQEKIEGIKGEFDKLHTGVLEKVGEYDKHITDVGTDIQALERVFQKILPGFLENVNELGRITEKLKKTSE
jgi:hypothetical protein